MEIIIITYIINKMHKNTKYAFQEDADRPLVAHISQHALLTEGCLLPGGIFSRGMSAGGGVSQHTMRQTPL